MGQPVGYRLHNPSPAMPGYAPVVTDPYGGSRQPIRQGAGGHGAYPRYQPAPQPPSNYKPPNDYQPPRVPPYKPGTTGNPRSPLVPPQPTSSRGAPRGYQHPTQYGSQMMRTSGEYQYRNPNGFRQSSQPAPKSRFSLMRSLTGR